MSRENWPMKEALSRNDFLSNPISVYNPYYGMANRMLGISL